jgi:phosphopantetheinyl transferase
MLEIWSIDLARHRQWLLGMRHLLADAELRRASRYRRAVDAERYLSSHAAVRMILAHYGAASGAFERSATGKPTLPGGPHFSLSRTDGAALVAVSDKDVGVDIERVRPVQLSEPAVLELAAAAGVTPLAAWTLLEAWAKWRGIGVAATIARLGRCGTFRWWATESEPLSAVTLPDRVFVASICSDVCAAPMMPLVLEP